MNQFINNMTLEMIVDLWIAVGIIIFFMIFRSGISYLVLKIFKIKASPKKIKKSAFYGPLRSFFSFFGIYLAIVFLQEPYNIPQNVMLGVTKIFKLVVIITTAIGLANSMTIQSFIAKKLKDKTDDNIADSRIQFALKLIRTVIYIVAGILCLTELGFNLNGLIAGVGIGGVIITLAAQDTAKNLFGGLMIFLDKPFVVGDYIQFENYEGTVEDITFRSTRVRTLENSVLHIPNAVAVGSSLVNCTQMEKRRYYTVLNLDQNTSIEKIATLKDKITKILKEHKRVIEDSEVVKFESICENGMQILIYAYVDEVDYVPFLEIKEDINYHIMQLIKNENIILTNSFIGNN